MKEKKIKHIFLKCHIHMLQNAAACQISGAPRKVQKIQKHGNWLLIFIIFIFSIFQSVGGAVFSIFSPSSVDSFVRANLCKSIYHCFSKSKKKKKNWNKISDKRGICDWLCDDLASVSSGFFSFFVTLQVYTNRLDRRW